MDDQSVSWRVHTSTIARALYREDLAGHFLFGKKIPVEQGEAAVWLSQGEVVKIVTGGQAVQANVRDRLKSLFASGKDLAVLMLDTTDILLHFRLGMERPLPGGEPDTPGTDQAPPHTRGIFTRDGKNLAFDVRLTVSLRLEKTGRLFTLMQDCLSLEKEDLAALCRNRLEQELLGPVIAEMTAEEIFSHLDTLARINQAVGDKLAAYLKEKGLHMERLAINPAMTEEEQAELVSLEDEDQARHAALSETRDAHNLERDFERMVLRDRLAEALENAILENDRDKQELLRAAFIFEKEKELEAARIEDRIERIRQETAHAARQKQEELRQYGIERSFEVESKRMRLTSELEMEQMRALAEEHRKNKEHKSHLKMREMETRRALSLEEGQHVERLLEMGAQEGVLTGDHIRDAIRHQTLRKALDEGGASAQAFANAEARRQAVEQFKDGMAHQAPQQVQGGPSVVLIQQGPGSQGQPGPARDQPRQLAAPETALPDDETVLTICPHCGKNVPDDAIFCGYCGKQILEQNP